jgi:hypothetical protein
VAAQCYLFGNAGAVHFIVIGEMRLLLRVEEAYSTEEFGSIV